MITRKISRSENKLHIKKIKEDGFSIIKSYLSGEISDILKTTAEKIYDHRKVHQKAPLGIQKKISIDKIINNIISYDNNFLSISTSGDHLNIYSEFLNDKYYGLIPPNHPNFILAQANIREGKSSLPFHVDVRLVTPGYKTWSMQGVIALSKKDTQTGGLRVRPGSHIFDYFPDSSKEYEDAIDVNLEKGDMAIFSSQLHHATYESQKKENTGWSLNLTYRSWWCKQQFDLWLMIDKKNKIALNENQKLILGGCSLVPLEKGASPSSRNGYSVLTDN